jgi:hypothetical protein
MRVRATARFFEDLDRQLPSERGQRGEPSTNDFQTFELLRIVETFAEQFYTLPELIPGRPDVPCQAFETDFSSGRFGLGGCR